MVSNNVASNRLFVGSLPWAITSEDLKMLFERVGSVVDAVVLTDKKTDKHTYKYRNKNN